MMESSVILNKNRVPDERSSGLLLNIKKNEFILLFGGSREKTYNEIWHLKTFKNENDVEWNEIKNTLTIPPRFGCCGAYCRGDNKGQLFIHGGQNYFENKIYPDMLLIDIDSDNLVKNIKNITTYPINIQSCPRERNSHSMIYDNSTNKLFLFGGGSTEGLLNDLWNFDINSLKWNLCEIDGDSIPTREMHGMVKYANFIYIFGGRLYEEIDKKMYRINLSTMICEYVCDMPSMLCSFAYSIYKNYIIIYGGTDGNKFINNIIIYNIANSKWAKSKIQINSDLLNNMSDLTAFLGRIGSMMAVDEESENLVIFGGSSIHKDTNYTFITSLKTLIDDNNLVPC